MLLKDFIEELESHIQEYGEELEELEVCFDIIPDDDNEGLIDLKLAGSTRVDYADKAIVFIDFYNSK